MTRPVELRVTTPFNAEYGAVLIAVGPSKRDHTAERRSEHSLTSAEGHGYRPGFRLPAGGNETATFATEDPSTFIYDEVAGRFRDIRTGQFVATETIRQLRDDFVESERVSVDDLSRQLVAGVISLDDWEAAMRAEIKVVIGAEYAFGRGGLLALDDRDWQELEALVTKQWDFLDNFASALEDGDLTPAQLLNRARMYVDAGISAYDRGLASAHDVYAQLPVYPGDDCEGLTNCRCAWDIVENQDDGSVDCFWIALGDKNTCAPCSKHADDYNPLHLTPEEVGEPLPFFSAAEVAADPEGTAVAMVLARLERGRRAKEAAEARLATGAPASSAAVAEFVRQFHSTQVNLPPELAARIADYQGSINPHDLDEGRLEQEPHVTVKFGLHPEVKAEDVAKVLENTGPIEASFGDRVAAFPPGPNGVPLYVPVQGSGLHSAHSRLGSLPHTDAHPEYIPHVTLAYVKPGHESKYVDGNSPLNGQRATFDHIVFSPIEGDQVHLPLSAGAPAPFAVAEADAHWITLEGGEHVLIGGGGGEHLHGFRTVSAAQFKHAVDQASGAHKAGQAVTDTLSEYSLDDYRHMHVVLSPDGKTGYALKPRADGGRELVSVFNVDGKGKGGLAVEDAVKQGATHLDAFDQDGFLPKFYAKYGFREVGRAQWDPELAGAASLPNGSKPDVVFMEREPSKNGTAAHTGFADEPTPERSFPPHYGFRRKRSQDDLDAERARVQKELEQEQHAEPDQRKPADHSAPGAPAPFAEADGAERWVTIDGNHVLVRGGGGGQDGAPARARTRNDIYETQREGGYRHGVTWIVDPSGTIREKRPDEKVIDRRDPGANTPYFAVQRRGDPVAYIGEMYVPESMRGQGMGQRMYQHMAEWAAGEGRTLISGSDRTTSAERALRAAQQKGLVTVTPNGEVEEIRPGPNAAHHAAAFADDEGGRWITLDDGRHIFITESAGQEKGGAARSAMREIPRTKGQPDAEGSIRRPIYTDNDLNKAARLIADGKHVRLDQPAQVATLIDKLGSMAEDAAAKGTKAPNYDLGLVTIPGTNLFTQESKGIPRVEMPQFSGPPVSGSLAARTVPPGKATADLAPAFRRELVNLGYKVTDETVPAAHLRATQMDLEGSKVAGMVKAMAAGKLKDEPIFVTQDNYVVDGHHRWAAKVALDLRDNQLGDVSMPVARVNTDIGTMLDLSNAFTRVMGIGAKAGPRARHGLLAMLKDRLRALFADDGGDAGHWVTIDGNHVLIGKGGEILEGGSHLRGTGKPAAKAPSKAAAPPPSADNRNPATLAMDQHLHRDLGAYPNRWGDPERNTLVDPKTGELYDVRRNQFHNAEEIAGTRRPLDYVYRSVSGEDLAGIQKNGYIQSDQRMNLSPTEGTVAKPLEPAPFYLPHEGPGAILKIRVDPRDGWRIDSDSYAKTTKRIPADRIVAVSHFLDGMPAPAAHSAFADDGGEARWITLDDGRHILVGGVNPITTMGIHDFMPLDAQQKRPATWFHWTPEPGPLEAQGFGPTSPRGAVYLAQTAGDAREGALAGARLGEGFDMSLLSESDLKNGRAVRVDVPRELRIWQEDAPAHVSAADWDRIQEQANSIQAHDPEVQTKAQEYARAKLISRPESGADQHGATYKSGLRVMNYHEAEDPTTQAALRLLGYDAVYVSDEGNLSLAVLSPRKLGVRPIPASHSTAAFQEGHWITVDEGGDVRHIMVGGEAPKGTKGYGGARAHQTVRDRPVARGEAAQGLPPDKAIQYLRQGHPQQGLTQEEFLVSEAIPSHPIVSLDQLDLATIHPQMRTLAEVSQDYPKAAETLEYAGAYNGAGEPENAYGGPNFWDGNAYAEVMPVRPAGQRAMGFNFMYFNPNYGHGVPSVDMTQEMDNNVRVGWFPPEAKNPGYLAAHEYGHVIAADLAKHNLDALRVWAIRTDPAARTAGEDASPISEYARVGPGGKGDPMNERLAESFAAYYFGSTHWQAQATGSVLKVAYGKAPTYRHDDFRAAGTPAQHTSHDGGRAGMTTYPAPMCMSCQRLDRTTPGLTCEAFPSGIPDDIWQSRFDHRQPHAGDHGLAFVQDPSKPEPRWSQIHANGTIQHSRFADDAEEGHWITLDDGRHIFLDAKGNTSGRTHSHEVVQVTQRTSAQARVLEKTTTPLLQDLANQTNGHMAELDFRFKTQESLARKIGDRADRKGISAEQSGSEVHDALRYTMIFDANDMARGADNAIKGLEAKGYKVNVDNFWNKGDAYNGLNGEVTDPKTGLTFELQFHTPESHTAMRGQHGDYEIYRDPTKPAADRQAAWQRMVQRADVLPTPPGIERIGRTRFKGFAG